MNFYTSGHFWACLITKRVSGPITACSRLCSLGSLHSAASADLRVAIDVVVGLGMFGNARLLVFPFLGHLGHLSEHRGGPIPSLQAAMKFIKLHQSHLEASSHGQRFLVDVGLQPEQSTATPAK